MRAENGALVVGAHVTHRELERSALVHERLPALARDGTRRRQPPRPRGGHARRQPLLLRPHSDPATFLLAVDAEVECRRGGEPARRVPIADFVVGPYQTILGQGELLTAVRIPVPAEGAARRTRSSPSTSGRRRPSRAWRASRTAPWPRHVSRSGRWARGRYGPRRPRTLLAGCRSTSSTGRGRGGRRPCAEDAAPVDDATGSAEYKAQLVRVLVERTFREALA